MARARSWGVTDRPFADLDELLTLAGYRRRRRRLANDVLARLVAVARHDDLADADRAAPPAPGLLAAARRHRAWDDDEAGLEELIGAVWLTIVSCRTTTGPTCVAGNIVRDATYRAFTAPRRRLSATEVQSTRTRSRTRRRHRGANPCEELAELLADARRAGMATTDVELVRDLVRVGSPSVVAAERGVTPRTVRNHRDRATSPACAASPWRPNTVGPW